VRMRYRFYTCDVFTDTRFGGNPLAVLPETRGLSDRQMQQIAREFNFSESTFVFPPEAGQTRKVRIFTPTTEIPFAGHPNVGTAFVLATMGELGSIEPALTVTFEEKAGLVPITIQKPEGRPIFCELTAPQRLSLGRTTSARSFARAISLDADDVVTRTHLPQVASVGLPFLVAELKDRAALERARINMDGLDALVAEGLTPDLHLYVHSADGFDLRARMFAPLDGVPEDPATGSANCALAGLLSQCSQETDGSFHWRIAQGVEMGRPSLLEARTEKRAGIVEAIRIGGACVLVSEGFIEVD
jgi:trans-2,3-dihydro-3-hydroxyanthranilate isomerase